MRKNEGLTAVIECYEPLMLTLYNNTSKSKTNINQRAESLHLAQRKWDESILEEEEPLPEKKEAQQNVHFDLSSLLLAMEEEESESEKQTVVDNDTIIRTK